MRKTNNYCFIVRRPKGSHACVPDIAPIAVPSAAPSLKHQARERAALLPLPLLPEKRPKTQQQQSLLAERVQARKNTTWYQTAHRVAPFGNGQYVRAPGRTVIQQHSSTLVLEQASDSVPAMLQVDERLPTTAVIFDEKPIFLSELTQSPRTAAARRVDADRGDLPGGFGSAANSSLDPPRDLLVPGRVAIIWVNAGSRVLVKPGFIGVLMALF